ncbi:hypothetical protein D3C76_1005230 [compost metagenome]
MPGRQSQGGNGQPGEGQMQRPEQRHTPDAGVVPARQAQQVTQAEQDTKRRQPGIGLQADAAGENNSEQNAGQQHAQVQPGPGLGLLGTPQPALGEKGNDPATDQPHQRRHQPKRGQHALAL